MLSLAEARTRVLSEARPGEAIEVALSEALGLVLAEPLTADVDLPPFDRAAVDGYAVRAADVSRAGLILRVVGRPRGSRSAEVHVEDDEAARVNAGDPMPIGADLVVRTEDTRPEPNVGPPRQVEILRVSAQGVGVVPRGYYLNAGAVLADAGTRLRLPHVGLLAAEGCVHPVCHRRARVAVLAVGDHLVGPADAPVMHRERNAAGPTAVAPCLLRGATAHDLGVIPERGLAAALDRALTASVVIVLGEPEGPIPRALKKAGIEPIFSGVSIHPGKRISYGVVRGPSGDAAHHVFHLAPGPIGVLTAVTLLVAPLIDRLHGGPSLPLPPLRALWSGPPHRATDDRLWAVPVTLSPDDSARLRATPLDHRGKDDLPGFSLAHALALLPPRTGPWNPGDPVDVVPLGDWPST